MLSSQDFESVTWSAEDDLIVEELVVRADQLLTSRKESSAGGAAICAAPSENPQQVLPDNALEGASDPSKPPNDQAADQAFRLPDLEDIGLVLDRRRFRAMGLSVTDFVALEWCQQQFALALTADLPPVSATDQTHTSR